MLCPPSNSRFVPRTVIAEGRHGDCATNKNISNDTSSSRVDQGNPMEQRFTFNQVASV
jgi:hypothetical protein